MFTTIDKAIAGGIVSGVSTEILHVFHIQLPGDVQTALSALLVALIIWATPNVQKILDQQEKKS